MNIQDYVFEGSWKLLKDSLPQSSQRVMFSNGDSIIIGSVNYQDGSYHYLFDRGNMEDYNPIAYMELPTTSVIKKYQT